MVTGESKDGKIVARHEEELIGGTIIGPGLGRPTEVAVCYVAKHVISSTILLICSKIAKRRNREY